MADRASYGLAPRLDIEQMLSEAQHRWLRPAEICEILRNYQKFLISSEAPDRPPSGSLFLFDRKVLRYFRKDGHNWRKKKDGKTVKEAHEKLKVGSIDVLHCYYAHGEENENFQRRSYWMLEQDLMHMVFVHYLEVKGSRTVGSCRESSEASYQQGSPSTSSSSVNHMKAHSGNADSPNPTSTSTSLYEDADSEDIYRGSSVSSSSPQVGSAHAMDKIQSGCLNPYSSNAFPARLSAARENGVSHIHGDKVGEIDHVTCENGVSHVHGDKVGEIDHATCENGVSHVHGDKVGEIDYSACVLEPQHAFDLASWEEGLEQCVSAFMCVSSSMIPTQVAALEDPLGQEYMIKTKPISGENASREAFGNFLPNQSNWQIPFGDNSLDISKWSMDSSSNFELPYDAKVFEQKVHDMCSPNAAGQLTHRDFPNEHYVQDSQIQITSAESETLLNSNSVNHIHVDENSNYALSLRKTLLQEEESLKKVDSFSRWISKELGEVDDLQMQSSSGIFWSTVESDTVAGGSSLSPSISQDQLFSIIDFSPKWTFTDLEPKVLKVLIIGTFLIGQQEAEKGNWSCMFGEVEVPAETMADGILSCYAPPHSIGQVPFYVTCSNRLACSEVREFDYKIELGKELDIQDVYGHESTEMLLHLRLQRLLSLRSSSPSNFKPEDAQEKRDLISKIISLKEEEESYELGGPSSDKEFSLHEGKKQLLQKLLKEKLYAWLLHKVIEDGKGPNILDEDGQGVLHLGAALGYDWAVKPTVMAGVSINFRDVNGWTGLHWAAFCGREQTVAFLISLGAAAGVLTDPSPEFPLGRTPADLASGSGHKGISGFLAETSLTNYLSSLTMDSKEEGAAGVSGGKAVYTVSQRAENLVFGDEDVQDELSLRDSLTAVCNATQAADRIHQVFRVQSFQRKQLTNYSDDVSDEQALSLLAARAHRSDGLVHAAATHIQKKYRGWKKRKEFLLIRQRIVKIQAHVRGHQVRKKYRTIIWSVGILEKVILRWRRKGTGLRGFRREALIKDPDPQVPSKEDDYDFLKEGRKQTEERQQKALDRVKSMTQYPEGRAQYRRLLTVVEGFRENKPTDMVLSSSEETRSKGDEELLDLDYLLDDNNVMSVGI